MLSKLTFIIFNKGLKSPTTKGASGRILTRGNGINTEECDGRPTDHVYALSQ
jgi:hypothetical protein